jgi:hypothetical protein
VLASLAGSPVRRTARTHRTQPARALTVVVSCRDLHEATDALAGAGGIPLVSLALASRSAEADSFVTEHTGDPWTDPVAASFPDPATALREGALMPRPACRRAARFAEARLCSRFALVLVHLPMAGLYTGWQARRRG